MGATSPIPITPSQTPAAPTQPVLDLQAQFEGIRDEVLRAVEGVFDSQQFILGKVVQLLEEEVAALVGVPYAIGCASGWAAEQTLALPIYPELRDEHQEHIVRTIAAFYSSRTTN